MSLELAKFTHREGKVIAHLLNGDSQKVALRKAGFSQWQAKNPSWYISEAMLQEVERQKEIMSTAAIEHGRITAEEIHDILSDALRANMCDIRNDDHTYKPRNEWPDIWNWLEEGGHIEVAYESERSHDGETVDKPGGWDRTGRTVEKVQFKFTSKAKLLELAMRHRAINAMVEQKQGDVNIVVVTAERQRQVQSAKKRLAKVIDVKPE